MKSIKILNLYAGIGGNRKLWGPRDITAVEIDPNIAEVYAAHYPGDKIIIGDAHEYLLNHYSGFDFIWGSPPCPTHSTMSTALKGQGIVRYPDMKLYQEITFLKHFFDGKWVVENVDPYYKPWIEPNTKINRHLFWCNFHISYLDIKDPMRGLLNSNTGEVEKYQKILGFDLSEYKSRKPNEKRTVLRNCVLPELGKHIFDCAIGSIRNEDQLNLFNQG